MKLRNKVLIAISTAWLLFLSLTYIGSNYFLIRSFISLEDSHADQDLGRIDQALDQINYSLYTFTSDWSHWNDLYDFMQDKNPAFVSNNLNMTAFVNSHINLLSYWDKSGKLKVGSGIDTSLKKITTFPKGIEKYIYPNSPLLNRKDVNHDIRGYAKVDNGILLIAASAITDGDKLMPILGATVTGRWFDQELVNKIADTTKLDVKLYLPNHFSENPNLNQIYQNISKGKPHFTSPIDEDLLQGYTIIKDINEEPIGMLGMKTPRTIYKTGQEAIRYYLISFMVLAVLFSGLILWLLRFLIIQRLEKLDHEVASIAAKKTVRQRVDASGSDELSSVSREINLMLDTIQTSQEQLEHRVEERTQELKQTNIQLKQEITERRAVERELMVHKENLVRLAHYDNLTNLPNRVLFNEILNKAIANAKKKNISLGILFIDLDRFKTINDALGHSTGDAVLKEMAKRFSSLIRSNDILARLGGDEFIVLLNEINHSEIATNIADSILKSASEPVRVGSHEFYISTSIGICMFPQDGESLEDLQKNADMAMYKAKRQGGRSYLFFSTEMNTIANQHIEMETALRRAITNQEFVLYFQPQLNLKTGEINRVEALIRWAHPTHGMISPATFIPLAEESGLILEIGEWAIQEAARVCSIWKSQGFNQITVGVNISPKQFQHQDVAGLLSKALKENHLPPHALEVEITETAIMNNVEEAIVKLNRIKSLGIEISIDDFGTGYTSISYLKQFPVSILKIDRVFVKNLPDNQNDAGITTAVIGLAHSLGLRVIAEGVETLEQLNFLADHQCDMIQGYYLGRPVPYEDIVFETHDFNSEKKTIV